MEAEPRFIEIVNWDKAQPNMVGENNPWQKLYTSLLDNDAFVSLDDAARVLIFALRLYAARTGRHVFPADPKWIHKRLPLLNSEPDLKPLLEAVDDYGNPKPLLRYCGPPAAEQPAAKAEGAEAAPKRRARKKQKEQSRADQSRVEESREEKNPKAERKSARRGVDSGKRVSSAQKTRVSAKPDSSAGKSRAGKSKAEQTRAEQPAAEQSQSQSTTARSSPEPAEPAPADPTNPDALGRQEGPRGSEAAPGSDKQPRSHRRNARPMSDALYDRYDIQFGRKIFIALNLPGDPDNGAIDETTSFASTWHKIRQQMSRAPPPVLDQLAARLLKEAHNIAKRRSARNKAAVWNDTAPQIAEAKASGP